MEASQWRVRISFQYQRDLFWRESAGISQDRFSPIEAPSLTGAYITVPCTAKCAHRGSLFPVPKTGTIVARCPHQKIKSLDPGEVWRILVPVLVKAFMRAEDDLPAQQESGSNNGGV